MDGLDGGGSAALSSDTASTPDPLLAATPADTSPATALCRPRAETAGGARLGPSRYRSFVQGGLVHWPMALGVFAIFCLFAPCWWGDEALVFRDVAYWHANTLHWTVQQWQTGVPPLWNDYQGLGGNWVGQGTTTVFYPGTWLLLLGTTSFQQAYTLVIALHLVLAGVATFYLSRVVGLRPEAAGLAALSYMLSGPVLVQHANWPFLISAAWFPLALAGLWRVWIKGQLAGLVVAAASLALMVLGGEPQAVGLWLFAAVVLWIAGRWHGGASQVLCVPIKRSSHAGVSLRIPGNQRFGIRSIYKVPVILVVLVLAGLASLVQLWPLWETAQGSTRQLKSEPRTLQAAIVAGVSGQSDWTQLTDGLLGQPPPDSQAAQALQYSQPPWMWLTLFSGNVYGTWRSVHARWDRLLPASDRLWNPTLYLGTMPALWVLGAWLVGLQAPLRALRIRWMRGRSWRDTASRRVRIHVPRDLESSTDEYRLLSTWLAGSVILFAFISCGWYGAVWLVTELRMLFQAEITTPSWGPHVGGGYWMLTTLVPGFDQFRYPAKWWLGANLAWSLAAGLAAQQLFPTSALTTCRRARARWRRICRVQMLLIIIACLLLLGLWAISLSPWFVARFFAATQQAPLDPWMGALNPTAALLDVHLALLQSLAVGALCLGCLSWWYAQLNSRSSKPAVAGWGIVALLVIHVADCCLANGWLIQTAPADFWRREVVWDRSVENPYHPDHPAGLASTHQRLYVPGHVFSQYHWTELQEKWGNDWVFQPTSKLAWQALFSMRATGTPHFHLGEQLPVLNAEQTLEPAEISLLRKWAERERDRAESATSLSLPTPEFWRRYLRSQGVRYQVAINSNQQLEVRTVPNSPPPVWWVDQWEVRARPSDRSPQRLLDDLRSIWLADGSLPDTPQRVVLDRPLPVPEPVVAIEAGDMSSRWVTVHSSLGAAEAAEEVESTIQGGVIDFSWEPGARRAVVRSPSQALTVWRQAFDPGWIALLTDDRGQTSSVEVVPAQRYLTAVPIPAGQYEVELLYRPNWYVFGAPLSLLGWCLLWFLWFRLKHSRTSP